MTHEIISIGRLAALKSGRKPDRVPVLPFVSGYAAKLCGMSLKEFFTDVNKCIEAQLLAKGLTPSVRAGSPTSMLASMTGLTNLLDWYLSEPEAVKALYQKVNEFLLKAVEVMLSEFGSNLLAWFSCPVDSNDLISPKIFEKFSWPALKEIIEGIQKLGVTQFFVHLCGNNSHNLTVWAELPWPDKTIISIDSCMDIVRVAEAFDHRHIIAGNVPTNVMAEGTFIDVYEASRNCIEKGKELPGGFILMPACELPVHTSQLNVSILVQAAKDFGIYDN